MVLKGAESVLSTVSGGHDAPEVLYVAECRTCHASSDLAEDEVRPAAVWAVQHAREYADHRHYVLTTRQGWRVERNPERSAPPEGGTVTVTGPQPDGTSSDQPPAGPTHHAKPRPSWPWPGALSLAHTRARGRLARYAGPPYVLGLGAAVTALLLGIFVLQKSPEAPRHPANPAHVRTS